jgi:hypothetical protein
VRIAGEFLSVRLYGPILERLGSDQPDVRAELVAAQLAGLGVARYVLCFEPLASAPRSRVVGWVAPSVQRYLTGHLSSPAAQSGPVDSRKSLSCALMFPNLVGLPKASASAQRMSSMVAISMDIAASTCARQAAFDSIAEAGASSTTRRRRTSAPSAAAPCATASASACTLPVAE